MTSQILPSSWAAWWYLSQGPENGSQPRDKYCSPTHPSSVRQALPGLSAQPQSPCWVSLWVLASCCPTSPDRLAGGPGPLGAGGGVLFLAGPPAFPHRPVLPRRHKLQRLRSGAKKNSGRGSLLPGGEPGTRGRWKELRRYTCVTKGACALVALTSSVSLPHEGKSGAGREPVPPLFPRGLQICHPQFGCLSSPNTQMASHAFPSPQTPSPLL